MNVQREIKPDLELKELAYFNGTENYYKVLGVKVTDGVKYVMDNGYAWFVTDALAVIVCKPRLRKEPFLAVKLRLCEEENEANLIIDDGNDYVLYRQHYGFTDAKRDLTLFYEYGVLMVNSEH